MIDLSKGYNTSQYMRLTRCLSKGHSCVLSGLTSVAKIVILERISSLSKKKILFITTGEQESLKYQNDLRNIFALNAKILPYQTTSLYDEVSTNKYDYAEQLDILLTKPNIVIAPVKVLAEKFPNEEFLQKYKFLIKKGDILDIPNLITKLINLGYKRTTMVSDIGEFSVRGDIIDVFAPAKNALRIELWGDEIVDLRYFNNETQKSIEKLESAEIFPLYKFTLPDNKNKINDEDEGYFDGIEVYQSLYNTDYNSVFDYLKEYIVVFDESEEIWAKYEFFEKSLLELYEENSKNIYKTNLSQLNHFTKDELQNSLANFVKIFMDNFISSESAEEIEFNSSVLPNFDADMDKLADFIVENRECEIIISTDFPDRVREILDSYGIFDYTFISSIASIGCKFDEFKLIILTDRELFNKRSKEITTTKRSYYKEKTEYIENINDIQEGEFVVHNVHGIGIYKGLTHESFDGQIKDYLTIMYANGDKLYIPAEQINHLCRYRGSGNVKPKLSKMGGNDWETTKTKVKKEVETIAYDLLRLYAKRKMAHGIQFLPDTTWQMEMEEAFEYTETPDQMKAITDVKSDMESENPMDRLICGDVGFGKTEVAMRAIFKAVTSGKQAAVIVPTTILTLQHYQTMSERFKPFGVNVEFLSRFKTAKEQKEVLKKMATGDCDVVIGTHRLLQDNIVFKDLGLLVIDEEHRFGVRHKEKLKKFRENIDIISMSATPIPRTLHMSLSGIKDLSVINTPPKNRLPIKTYVGNWTESIVKNAITYELDREGQVFYLYNRVETINEMKYTLQKLVPNARIAIGHGQMDEKELEQVILDFADHKYDVLLASTIIENGIDIPNANTIIIHDADRFGLAQLYQLRGRVGRSGKQAFCYCLYKKTKEITKEATARLKAIKEFTTLGSGYKIAMRDVEIRGVGNILGTKQHGHMVNVGFDTYCELLNETVQELQGQVKEKEVQTIVDLNVTAFIPDEWVGSKEQKMIEYKRLADVKNDTELDYIVSEWHDRFSKIPESVENLIKLIKIRLIASKCKIGLIRETPENIRIYTPFSKPEWNMLSKKLPFEILKLIKFTIAPATCKDGISILSLNSRYLSFNELYEILIDMCEIIEKTILDYKEAK